MKRPNPRLEIEPEVIHRRRKRLFTCYLEQDQIETLRSLHENTKIPMAVLIREGIDLLFEHRSDQLEGVDD